MTRCLRAYVAFSRAKFCIVFVDGISYSCIMMEFSGSDIVYSLKTMGKKKNVCFIPDFYMFIIYLI